MIDKDDIKRLAEEYKWEEITSRNPHMMSFTRGYYRMNVYFTTMTVTVQSDYSKIDTRRNVTFRELEKIFIDYNAR